MNTDPKATPSPEGSPAPHRRRTRYAGRYPRRFAEKYKERQPGLYPETVAKVMASGKTPAGSHRPIMVAEVLGVLAPQRGEFCVDCTLGHGGHAEALLQRLLPGGALLGLDADPIELPKTEARLRGLGLAESVFKTARTNFAGLPQALASWGRLGADLILADLGVSSMQLDDPARGFSLKAEGPLDMRMNPRRGRSAAELLRSLSPAALAELLVSNADERYADLLARALAGRTMTTTLELAWEVRRALPQVSKDEAELAARRVFQALRIAVNDEFSALEALLRFLPQCLNPGGRVAILSFHSGEDRRVKNSFAEGLRKGIYAAISPEVIRPSADERYQNPRSAPAKLRWARKAGRNG